MIETFMHWKPNTPLDTLQQRARLITNIRQFFAERQVLEVETPLLSTSTVTDPHVHGVPVPEKLFLQTSPEYAMKRLLAAGSGCIYQISKAFRQHDQGQFHHPEFTMLEWYRLGFDHHDLMDEMDALLQTILSCAPAERMSYQQLFQHYLAINPHTSTIDELKACVAEQGIHFTGTLPDVNAWLDLLLTHCIEPHIAQEKPLFLYDFPVSQAALARIRNEDPPVASRFEVYFKGIELANGFHELASAVEQRKRFENDLAYRRQHQLPVVPVDENFLHALEHGLPDCAGVALGVDRLVMLALGKRSISDVISFT